MKLGIIKNIVREELAKFGELPKWLEPFLQTLNQFISNVAVALKGNLTFQDNFFCRVKDITLTHGVEQQINPEAGRNKVSGAICLSANGLIIDQFGWRQLTNGNIGITINYNNGTEAKCRIVIFLE